MVTFATNRSFFVKSFRFVFSMLVIMGIFVSFCSCNRDNSDFSTENAEQNNELISESDMSETFSTPEPEQIEIETTENLPVVKPDNNRCFYGENTGTSLTFTGLEPLEKHNFMLKDVNNSHGYPNELISHSYGYASDEKPHTISVEYQRFFNENNYDAICYNSDVTEKVVYLTFDCGYENGYTSMILDVLKEYDVPAAFFCTLPQVRDNQEIISRMINEGHIVGNHSVTHPDFSTLTRQEMLDEVKGFDDYMRENFGYSSFYFRYPQGKYTENSLAALNELGFMCVFWSLAYADWDLNDQKGADYALSTVISRIHPGAVILLHAVSPDNANALADIIVTARSMGYTFKSLNDI